MANYVGTRLSRLIRERAYLAGSLPALHTSKEQLQEQLTAATIKLDAAQERLGVLDGLIAEISAINPEDIRSVRLTPRKLKVEHGAYRRELLRILKESDGPVETSDMVRHMVESFGIPHDTRDERRKANQLVRDALRVFRNKGAVRRLSSVSINGHGLWEWVDHTTAKKVD